MSIKSTAFGGVTLTGDDARKFKNQIRYGRSAPAAVASAKRGSVLLSELNSKGSVRVIVHKKAISPAKAKG